MPNKPEKPKRNVATPMEPPTTSIWDKAIEGFRPDRKSGIKYNIDQTRALLDGGETKIVYHQTKAMYKYPLPDEVPIQEDSYKEETIRHCSKGIGPMTEYLEDKWEREAEEYQREAIKHLKKRLKRANKERKQKKRGIHAQLCEMAGPDWFQEMSPNQMKAADGLKQAIDIDLRLNSTVQTRIIIAKLGLVLRPNSKHVEFALKHCCSCPIEFLLLLYHLIDPNRKSYSVNDRILLTAVTHLTLPSTLMEMHIRIPSPPPASLLKKKRKKKRRNSRRSSRISGRRSRGQSQVSEISKIRRISRVSAKQKEIEAVKERKRLAKLKAISPYLEEFTFKPPERKYKGHYKKTTKYWPTNPYFNYVHQLRHLIAISPAGDSYPSVLEKIQSIENQLQKLLTEVKSGDVLADSLQKTYDNAQQMKEQVQQNVLLKERLLAQEDYDMVWLEVNKPAPRLQTCHVYCPCNRISKRIRENIFREACQEMDEAKPFEYKSRKYEPEMSVISSTMRLTMEDWQKVDELVATGAPLEEVQKELERDKATSVKRSKKLSKGSTSSGSNAAKSRESLRKESKTLASPNKRPSMECDQYEINVDVDITTNYKQTYDEGTKGFVTTEAQNTCACTISLEDKTLNPDGSKTHGLTANSGLSVGDGDKMGQPPNESAPPQQQLAVQPEAAPKPENEKPAESCCPCCGHPMVPAVPKKAPECICDKDRFSSSSSSDSESVAEVDDGLTFLADDKKKEMQEMLSPRKVLCGRNPNPTFTIAGIRICDGQETYIISDVYEKQCDCLYNYEQQMKAYLDQQKRQAVEKEMAQAEPKHIITGVTQSASGTPVYILGGVAPPHMCSIVAERERLQREHMAMTSNVHAEEDAGLMMMYKVSGLKKNDQGDLIHQISEVQALEECKCMKLYKQFNHMHRRCFEAYDDYMQQIQIDTREYLLEMDPVYRAHARAHDADNVYVSEYIMEENTVEEESTPVPTFIQDQYPYTGHDITEDMSDEDDEIDHDVTVTVTLVDKDTCPCCGHVCAAKATCMAAGDQVFDRRVSEPKEPEEKKIEVVKVKSKSKHKISISTQKYSKYFIYRKLPKKKPAQLDIIQKVLKSLAEDGFPLAKLPESYKLPIFDLWMDLRCGRFFTVADIEASYELSKTYWNHTDICQGMTEVPQMPISTDDCHKLNADALPAFKEQIKGATGAFYRKVKHILIDDSREFYPTLFYYQFPFPTYAEGIPSYRDTYFAYMPTKEEDVMAFKPWYPFETMHK